MKSAGDPIFRVGCRHRSKASKPVKIERSHDQWLIVQLELLLCECLAKIVLERAAALDLDVHAGLEKSPGSATLRFGAVKCDVRVAQEVVRRRCQVCYG